MIRRISGAAIYTRSLLAHDGGVLGFYFVHHSEFAGLAVGIFVDPEIFLGHLVDVGAGAIFCYFAYASANFYIAVGILRIHDGDGDARVAADVAILLASLGGIKNDVFAVKVDPYGRDLRSAVRHEGSEIGEGALLKKITVFLGDNVGHKTLLAVVR